MTAPAHPTTDPSSVAPLASSSSGIEHHHYHYHHYHYRHSPYLIVSIFLLLALLSWQAGWDYGVRAGVATTATLKAGVAGDPHP